MFEVRRAAYLTAIERAKRPRFEAMVAANEEAALTRPDMWDSRSFETQRFYDKYNHPN